VCGRVTLRQEQAAEQGAARDLITLDQLAEVAVWTTKFVRSRPRTARH